MGETSCTVQGHEKSSTLLANQFPNKTKADIELVKPPVTFLQHRIFSTFFAKILLSSIFDWANFLV